MDPDIVRLIYTFLPPVVILAAWFIWAPRLYKRQRDRQERMITLLTEIRDRLPPAPR
jgi:hypothetical protein